MLKIINQFPPFLLVGLWAIFILLVSTVGIGVNLPSTLSDIIAWDKLAHAFVYLVLCYLIYHNLIQKTSKKRAKVYALTLSIGYGILMEIVQYSFFPNRYFEFLDIFANIVGSILSIVFIYGMRYP
ncbi:MAG: VanZ family protein [Bacteroidota bacterium]